MAELPLIRFARHAALATAAFVTPPIALAAQSASAPADFVPAHDTLIIASHALGETRPIHVHVPRGYSRSSSRRFPVLYMPDGGIDEDFPHVVNTVDSLIALGRIRPVIVVGIPNTQRRRDLTGPTRVAKDSTIAPRVGGSRAFRRFIRDELIPVIDARYRTTRERSIVGPNRSPVCSCSRRSSRSPRSSIATSPSIPVSGGTAGRWSPMHRGIWRTRPRDSGPPSSPPRRTISMR